MAWLIEHGPIAAVGVEGTSSYGRGVTTELCAAGIRVVEVNRTRPAERRKQGKTGALDAHRAARSVQSGEASTDPKAASIEPLRVLTVARRSARKAQQATVATDRLPAHQRPGGCPGPLPRPVRGAPGPHPGQVSTRSGRRGGHRRRDALAAIAGSPNQYLIEETADLEQRMRVRTTRANPGLMAIKGVGPVTAAQLLITAGDNPDRLRTSVSLAALLRHLAHPRQLGPYRQPPPQPQWRPASQRSPPPHRQESDDTRPGNQDLPR